MRGDDLSQSSMFSYLSPEDRVPSDHPARRIRELVNRALGALDERFEAMYSCLGRPSIAPEKLLRALLLQVLYTIRSERRLMEELNYNLLFRWFVGLNMDDAVWDPTVFCKNRDRLLAAEVAEVFFQTVLEQAQAEGLLSAEHFSVDGTLVEAWASKKRFQPRANPPAQGSGRRGEKQLNDTHVSQTDPDARMYKKSAGGEAKLCFMAHLVSENRNGLVVGTEVTTAGQKAEREAALSMLEQIRGGQRRVTLGADKAYDQADFIAALRQTRVTPHVAQYVEGRSSHLDRRTTRHPGYRLSLEKRKRIEEIFGWLKTVAGMRKARHRGLAKVRWMFTLAVATYNLVRMSKLIVQPA